MRAWLFLQLRRRPSCYKSLCAPTVMPSNRFLLRFLLTTPRLLVAFYMVFLSGPIPNVLLELPLFRSNSVYQAMLQAHKRLASSVAAIPSCQTFLCLPPERVRFAAAYFTCAIGPGH